MLARDAHELATATPSRAYSLRRRLAWLVGALAAGVLVAGFWNYKTVDGFGSGVVAGHTVGNPASLAGGFAQHGVLFGFLFAVIAGLATTFTACNVVVFAMIPGLSCSTDRNAARRRGLRALALMMAGVLLVGAVYGAFVGTLGSQGVAAFNKISLPQAQAVFSFVGLAMLLWAAIDLGFFDGLLGGFSPITRAFFAQDSVKSLLMGLLVGMFMVGRPFPVFRDLLTYAATAHNPFYGAGIMMLQGLGQIAVMVLLFAVVLFGFGKQLARWSSSKPYQPPLVSALALAAGGMYFLYYWGIAISFNLGSWGFRLGWYH